MSVPKLHVLFNEQEFKKGLPVAQLYPEKPFAHVHEHAVELKTPLFRQAKVHGAINYRNLNITVNARIV